jgi:hypothetical protein
MKAKEGLMAALVGIAMLAVIPIVAAAGDQNVDEYQDTEWQAPGAVIPVGHHYGWRNRGRYNPGLICDEDGDDCHDAVQCDQDGDDCQAAVQCDGDGDDCEPFTGYQGRHYDSYGYNSGYNGGYDTPYYNDGRYGSMSNLAPLLRQFVQ